MIHALLAIFAMALSPANVPANVAKEARLLSQDRGKLFQMTLEASESGDIDSGYTSMTMASHTQVLFPFGNGHELLYWTWGSAENPHRLTYWRREGSKAVRVCQMKVRSNSDDLPKWVLKGGTGAPASTPKALTSFLRRGRPYVVYCVSAAIGELMCGVIRANGSDVDADYSKEKGVNEKASFDGLYGGPPIVKEELEFLKKRAERKKAG
jgi:hypothetical protein